ncbi:MAG: DEAD/DEAH box helicase [Magnetococcales bacterium]|nr:DEAD/DEAH box helicase [Magnetococcales bacterium]
MFDNAPEHTQLLAELDRLDGLDRRIVQLSAIIHDVVPVSQLVACLKRTKIKLTGPFILTVRTVQGRVESLLARGMLRRGLGTGFHFLVAREIADDAVRQAVADGVLPELVRAVDQELPALLRSSPMKGTSRLVSFDRAVREIRLGLLTGDEARVLGFSELAEEQRVEDYRRDPPLVRLCSRPWNPEWMASLSLSIQVKVLEEMVGLALTDLEPVAEIGQLLQRHREQPCTVHGPVLRALEMTVLLVQGRLREACELAASGRPILGESAFRGWIDFFQGKNRQAIATLETTISILDEPRKTGHQKLFPYYWSGLFLLFALLSQGALKDRQNLLHLVQRFERNRNHPLASSYQAMRAVAMARSGDGDAALLLLGYRREALQSGLPWLRQEQVSPLLTAREGGWNPGLPKAVRPSPADGLPELVRLLALYWIDHEALASEAVLGQLKVIHLKVVTNDYPWLVMESAALLERLTGGEEYRGVVETMERQLGFAPLTPRIQREERWEQTLTALMKMTGGDEDPGLAAKEQDRRLIWLIETHGQRGSVQAREQVRSDSGEWSRGRVVAARRLHGNEPRLWGFLTEQDLEICAAVRQEYIYNGTRYDFDWSGAMLAMIGHPHVYWLDNPTVNVEVVRGEPELLVHEHEGRIRIRFSQRIDGPGVMVLREGPNRCRVIKITGEHHKIADILGPDGFIGPGSQKDRVMGVVARLAPMVNIQSTVDTDLADVPEVPSDSRPRVQLVPHGVGLTVRLMVRPFGCSGPWCRPGRGGMRMFGEREGHRVQVRREFVLEQDMADEVAAMIPTLAGRSADDRTWTLEVMEECLELLSELQALADKVTVEWPEGERFRVSHKVSMDRLRLRVRRDRDWFSVSGTLVIDDELILEMGDLLKKTREGTGRFISLGEGQFVALTESFRRRLEEMLDLAEEGEKGWRVHSLTAPWLAEMAAESGRVSGDRHWKGLLERLEAMEGADVEIPSTFKGELREYQIQGFRWLHRLSVWGVGGCLADDMGLGKTLQAMALLVYRAAEGPALVVAPTSVCTNWEGEIRRFAPTLNPILLGGRNRRELVEDVKAFDVLIVSYALLQIEEEMLAKVAWHTIVLDEAQAIKNRLTKRSRAAMRLNGNFRFMTTGTPIENHLGELWNLFRFLNPGLLGSLEQFNERFALPIERYRDRDASRRLKTRIRPFILRRTKNQVLTELPPLTEIVLHVEMDDREAAFYESLRQQAVTHLEGVDGAKGEVPMAVLAELMKLRRACCNSRLVDPDLHLQSAKFETFKDVARTLLANRHKALVFSQFVDHLTIIREFLTTEGISFQYLDGATPVSNRRRAIEDFQKGGSDFFLISLKAGGVGLNLTAADYVIHMDPWWNPAVEDQASNRAHRFGQKRPVTVYRLVTRGTIEEKIVALHASKRDLADDLLEGGDMSGRLSAEELLGLIREPLS